MTATALRCGVVGVGRMGRHHARCYAQLEGAELVGVVDLDEARARAVVEEWGGTSWSSLDDLLEAGVDAVTIATPTSDHRASVERFLAAGVACLVEKPLAPTVEEARAVAAIAECTGTLLQVGHVVRFDPVMRAILALEGLVPRFIEMHRVSPMTFRSVDVGVVLDMMIHDLDLLLLLTGAEPDEIHASAVGVLGEAEDVCSARLVFPSLDDGPPCVANLTASRLALKTERRMRIISESMYVSADFAAASITAIRRTANEAQLADIRSQLAAGRDLSDIDWLDLVKIEEPPVPDDEPLRLQIEAFLDALRTGTAPEVDAEAGVAAVRTAERIVEAARAVGATMV